MQANCINKLAVEVAGERRAERRPVPDAAEALEANDTCARLHASTAVSGPRHNYRGPVRGKVQNSETFATSTQGSISAAGKLREPGKPATARRRPLDGGVAADRFIGFASVGAIILAIVIGLTLTIAVGENPLARSPVSAASDAGDLDDYFDGLVRLGIARDPHVSHAPAAQSR